MFPKKNVVIVGILFLVVINIIILFVSNRRQFSLYGAERIGISIVAPFQNIVTHSICFVRDMWRHYFFLVSAAKEAENLRRALSCAIEKNNRCVEIELSNLRLRNLLNFRKSIANQIVAAEVIGKDPALWFKTIIIDKGRADGVKKSFPVVVAEGIAGQVIDVSNHYSKVLLIIDRNSAVDALVQGNRARGVVTGESTGRCLFKYVLRKHDLSVGGAVVTSGLDGVFPKGLRIGRISGVIKRNSGMFQKITVTPYVDFEKLEEVLVILNSPKHEFVSKQ